MLQLVPVIVVKAPTYICVIERMNEGMNTLLSHVASRSDILLLACTRYANSRYIKGAEDAKYRRAKSPLLSPLPHGDPPAPSPNCPLFFPPPPSWRSPQRRVLLCSVPPAAASSPPRGSSSSVGRSAPNWAPVKPVHISNRYRFPKVHL